MIEKSLAMARGQMPADFMATLEGTLASIKTTHRNDNRGRPRPCGAGVPAVTRELSHSRGVIPSVSEGSGGSGGA